MINRMNRVNGRLEEDTSPLASAVRYDADQIRSEDEKAQARANMGAISAAQLADTKADLEEQIENISGISDPEAVSQMVEDVAKHEEDISALKSALETTYAKQDGYYQDMTVGAADQVISSTLVTDSVPYKFRASGGSADIGNRAYMDKIVGGTVAFNQLVTNGNFASSTGWRQTDITATISNNQAALTATAQWGRYSYSSLSTLIVGHKYLFSAEMKGTTSNSMNVNYGQQNSKYLTVNNTWTNVSIMGVPQSSSYYSVSFGDNSTSDFATFYVKNVMVFDLTQMFGQTVADYIYTLEQSTAGAGVAFFRSLFPDPYYEYNAGELISVSGLSSHDTVGFNAWDEEWEVGGIDPSTGEPSNFSTRIRSKNYIPLIGGATYYFNIVDKTISTLGLVTCYYDKDKNYIVGAWRTNAYNPFTVPNGARYMKFCMGDAYGTTYNHDICINLSHSGARNGEYEPYKKHSYPLDSSLTLRGVPKLDSSNNLYWDGDEYAPDGTVTRRYGIVDLGTAIWTRLDTAISGKYRFGTGIVVNSIKKPSSLSTVASVISSKYNTVNGDVLFLGTTTGLGIHTNGNVIIYDDALATADTAAFKSAMSGVYLIYELATPTTETADAYQQVQNVDDYGTEEFVSTSIVPVGHVTRYPANLRDKLQHLPDLAASDGTYVILQSGSQMTLAPLTTPTELPAAPSADGTYTLKATVSNGAVTYSWEA